MPPAETARRTVPGDRAEPHRRRTGPRGGRCRRTPGRGRRLRRATGDIMAPMGPLTHETAVEMFPRTGRGPEGRGRRRALAGNHLRPRGIPRRRRGLQTGRHALVRHHELRHSRAHDDGPDLEGMARMVEKLDNPPIAFGANCGVGASDLLRTVLGFSALGIERPIIAKGNAGIPKYEDGHIHYDGTPELMADYAVPGPRLRRHDHRRLLRHHARAPGEDARGALDPPARPASDPRPDHRKAGGFLIRLRRHRRRCRPGPPTAPAQPGLSSPQRRRKWPGEAPAPCRPL